MTLSNNRISLPHTKICFKTCSSVRSTSLCVLAFSFQEVSDGFVKILALELFCACLIVLPTPRCKSAPRELIYKHPTCGVSRKLCFELGKSRESPSPIAVRLNDQSQWIPLSQLIFPQEIPSFFLLLKKPLSWPLSAEHRRSQCSCGNFFIRSNWYFAEMWRGEAWCRQRVNYLLGWYANTALLIRYRPRVAVCPRPAEKWYSCSEALSDLVCGV